MTDRKLGVIHYKDKIFLGYLNPTTNQLEDAQEATSEILSVVVSWFLEHQQVTLTAPDPTTEKPRVISCLTKNEHRFAHDYWAYCGAKDDTDIRDADLVQFTAPQTKV